MKKFGTPIGAGPGSESEKVGFDAVGTPLPVGSVTFGLALRCPPWLVMVVVVVVVCGRLEGFCFLVGRLGTGLGPVFVDEEVEVELEVELDDEDDDELELELESELVELELVELELLELGLELELVVVLAEPVLSAMQLSDTTEAPGGSGRLAGGVPGGMLAKTIGWG